MRYGKAFGALSVMLLTPGWLYHGTVVSAASAGKIIGTIKLEGTPPHVRHIDMSKEPACEEVHQGKPVPVENVAVGPSGGLANVVVYISQGLTGKEPTSTLVPQIVQKGCQYFPHVVAINPGQHIKILNNDQVWHNIRTASTKNPAWNKSQSPGSAPLDVAWNVPEVIPVGCQLHPWMGTYAVVVSGPNSVTGEDGTFKLDNLAPGTYTVTAWHESLGTLTQQVTVVAGKPTDLNFSFKSKGY